MEIISIKDIEGIRIGNSENKEAATGCTVIIAEEGATCGVDIRGGAPGTRETDLLDPINLVDKVHAVVLSGGSAFGLDASSGVMAYLEEKNIGFAAGPTKVPIVTSAVLFDLDIGDYRVRPDFSMGYQAAVNSENNLFEEGCHGAGTGATVGKFFGPERAMKGGLGSYAIRLGRLELAAVVAVNALGDIVDSSGNILAGLLDETCKYKISTENEMIKRYDNLKNVFNTNTTIGAIVTNAKLTKAEAKKISSMAHNAYARAIRPSHTMFDGDSIFTMGLGKEEVDINLLGVLAAKVMEEAIRSAIYKSQASYGYKSFNEL